MVASGYSWIVGLVALLALGLFTLPVVFILAGEMVFAYRIAHAPRSFFPLLDGGASAILYCLMFDHLAGRRRLEPRRQPQPIPRDDRVRCRPRNVPAD